MMMASLGFKTLRLLRSQLLAGIIPSFVGIYNRMGFWTNYNRTNFIVSISFFFTGEVRVCFLSFGPCPVPIQVRKDKNGNPA